MRQTVGIFWVVMLGLAPIGCANSKVRVDSEYRTTTSVRDTEQARRMNDRGAALYREAKLVDAEAAFKQALKADVMFGPAHNNLGKVYFDQQEYYLAAWEFEYAAKLMRHRPEPRNNLGLVFEEVGQLGSAVASYTEALELEPDNPELIGNLARALIRTGRRDGEVKDLLQQLVMKDTRPQWVEWAREQLSRM